MKEGMVESFGKLPSNECPSCGAAPFEFCYVIDGDKTIEIPDAVHALRAETKEPAKPRELNMLSLEDATDFAMWLDECVKKNGKHIHMALDTTIQSHCVVLEESPNYIRAGLASFSVIANLVKMSGGTAEHANMEDLK